ncbi:hypothetical protein [Rhizobium sp. YTU87027]|uniref:hypothetical protein n=1 Tax=Rhizobium sp. YTU87027 TaxID=3417741 RepID=UPI003D69B28D
MFVRRDDSGKIVEAVTALPDGWVAEELPADDPELVAAFTLPGSPITSVSARQFKLQLLASGLLNQVDAWIATQSKAVQIAYEYSGTFVRTEPMMAAGFAAMGFTEEQVDAFFTAASNL